MALAAAAAPAPASPVAAAVRRAVRPTPVLPRTARPRSRWRPRTGLGATEGERGCPRLAAGAERGAVDAAGSPAAVGVAEATARAWLSPWT